MIDLLNDQVAWEERQILKRGETLVRSQVSQDEELILNRKLQGVALGVYTLSQEEQALLSQFQAVTLQAQQDVAQAKSDNALLKDILAYEQAERTIAKLTLLIDGRAEAWPRTGAEVVPSALVECPGGIGTVSSIRPHDPALGETEDDDIIAIWIEGNPDIRDDYRYEVFAVQHVPAVEPLAPTVDSVDEQGNPVTVDNPAYLDAVTARDTAQAVLDGASADVLGWVEQRR